MADSLTWRTSPPPPPQLTDACVCVWHPKISSNSSRVSAARLSLWNTGGGVFFLSFFNESFNSFLTSAVIELNSHRRAGSSAHHKPFPPIRDGGSLAAGTRAAPVRLARRTLDTHSTHVYMYMFAVILFDADARDIHTHACIFICRCVCIYISVKVREFVCICITDIY